MPFTTPVLDSFNRANENPLNTSNWQGRVSNPLKLVSNQATGSNASDFNQSVWLPGGAISGDCEAYCTLGTRDSWSTVLARCPTGSTSSALTGYELGSNSSGTLTLARYNPNGGLGTMSLSLSPGDKIGISCVGTTISGWTWTSGGGWVQRLTATDSTFSSGLIGARQWATTGTIDDFGGGSTAVATPAADFTGTPTSGTASLSVTFTDTSTNTPTSWAWTFGDGGTSTSQNPSHSYTSSGVYTVTLIATNTAGSNTKTRTGYITVSETISYASGGGIFIY